MNEPTTKPAGVEPPAESPTGLDAGTGPTKVLERTPLRVQLVVLLVGLTALALIGAGAASVSVMHNQLMHNLDLKLSDITGRQLERLSHGDFGRRPGIGMMRDDDPDGSFWIVSDAAGTPYEANTSVRITDTSTLTLPALDVESARKRRNQPFTVRSAGGTEWRMLLTADPKGQATVLAAYPTNDVEKTLHQLLISTLIIGLLVLLLVALMAYWLVRRSLRPLKEVEATAHSIASGELSSRIPPRDPRTEVGRLTESLNTMLHRIETAFTAQAASEAQARASEERMRRFVADASHELRTPLTSIRGFAELYRQGGVPATEVPTVMGRMEADSTRMSMLVEDLLLLARLDQQRPLDLGPVDLTELVADVVTGARALSSDHEVRWQAPSGLDALYVLGDERRLHQVVLNLVTNGLRHTPVGTQVTVTLEVEPQPDSGTASQPPMACLSVADNGPGMSEEQAAHVFERFYRADPSRTRAAGGSGLGLSIVAAIVAAHHGSVAVHTTPGEGAAFVVKLPLFRDEGVTDETPTPAEGLDDHTSTTS